MTRASYTGPVHPIGYVEVQSSWVGDKSVAELQTIIDELRAKALSENPGYKQDDGLGMGARLESVADGAGVMHHTLYMGFVPVKVAAEPLGNNLNDAPLPEPGWPEPTDGIAPIGHKEAQFGRGTD